MKDTLYILFVMAALVVAAFGCTRNNGAIGAWFGTWQITAISLNGQPTDYPGNDTAKFQNDIIETDEQHPGHTLYPYWATWRLEGSTLTINTRGDRSVAPQLHLPQDAVSTLELTRAPGRKMQWRYTDAAGDVYVYDLQKLY